MIMPSSCHISLTMWKVPVKGMMSKKEKSALRKERQIPNS